MQMDHELTAEDRALLNPTNSTRFYDLTELRFLMIFLRFPFPALLKP